VSARAPIIAIDGPAGSGKSTVARRLADRLGYLLLDTGALYRAVALAAQRARVDWDDEPAVAELARELVRTEALVLQGPDRQARSPSGEALEPGGSGVRVLLGGEDVSEAIRTAEMSAGASRVSSLGGVRQALLALQRRIGDRGGVVVEGRDIGTVVFPNAEVKLYLTASPEVRARRRHDELCARGAQRSFEQTSAEVRERDRADTARDIAPLKQADDALLVDSTGLGVDDVVERILSIVRAREGA